MQEYAPPPSSLHTPPFKHVALPSHGASALKYYMKDEVRWAELTATQLTYVAVVSLVACPADALVWS